MKNEFPFIYKHNRFLNINLMFNDNLDKIKWDSIIAIYL